MVTPFAVTEPDRSLAPPSRTMPAKTFNKDDLPAPDGPARARSRQGSAPPTTLQRRE